MESTPGEDIVKTDEMNKDLEYYIVDKAVAGFEKTDSNCKKVLLRVKRYQTISQSTKKLITKEQSLDAANFTAVLL